MDELDGLVNSATDKGIVGSDCRFGQGQGIISVKGNLTTANQS